MNVVVRVEERIGVWSKVASVALLGLALLPLDGVVAGEPPQRSIESAPGSPVDMSDPSFDWSQLKSAAPVSLDQAPAGVLTGVAPGRKSVLVYMDPVLLRESVQRAQVKQFTQQRGGHVRYEYGTVMPNVLNLRNLTPADIEQLKRMPGVVNVEEDLYHFYVLNLDEATPVVRALQSQISGAGLSADGTGVRVCVADTGIDIDHMMYASRIDSAAGWDFANNDSNPDDDNGHGSHVAGIAVGGTGITVDLGCDGVEPFQGVAPNATLIGVKILNSFGGGTDSDIIAGIDHCADQTASGGRADVINLSIGTGNFAGICTHSWAVASNNAVANGVVVVAASGNENNANSMGSPACGADVIAVGATYKAAYPNCEDGTSNFNWGSCSDNSPALDQIVCFSNQSDFLDVSAPGSVILSASNAAGGTSTTSKSGTSMASPMVAGLAALVLDADGGLTPAQVRQLIRDGATDLGPAGFDRAYGFGRIDAVNTLSLVTPCTTNADCDDLDPCTTDVCSGGSCSSTPISCPPGQTCNGGICEGQGACCVGQSCSIDSPTNCSASGGAYLGDGSVCGSGTAGNPTVYQNSPNATIPDGGGAGNPATATINVPDSVIIGDLDVDLTITHTWVGDLTVMVSHGGTTVTILDRPGVPSSQFGCSMDNYSGLILDDEGTGGSIEAACANNLSSPPNYTPNNALSAFDGMDSAGVWTITVFDSVSADGGTLNTWSLHIDAVGSNPCSGGCTTNAQCDDGNGCTDDVCNAGVCVNTNNTAACDDGDACTTGDTCSAGACVGGAPLSCDDGNVCTTDSCNPASGCVNTNNTAACDDGDACTTGDTCSAGTCTGGAPLNCDDGNVCTTDSCNPASGCVNTNNTVACDDGDACTTGDICSAGTCAGGAPLSCDDGNVCTTDSCNPASGCVNTNNTAACDDGDACTTGDTCSAGACVSGAPLSCDDGNVCTTDSCNPASGCVNTNNTAACDDGDACTVGDTCSAGVCVGGAPPNCDDGNICTDDSCDPVSGACVNANNTAACDDGDACTVGDTCSAGVCASGSPLSCDDGNVCTDDSCNPANGCVNTNNTATCDDGDACTAGDACSGGVCIGGAPPNCDDGNICTDDSCDPLTGACVNTNNTAACDDGDLCTTGDACSAGVCVSGAPANCDDGNVCTDDSCDPLTGACVNANNTAACDDGNACTSGDTCSAGACVGGAPPNCDDGNVCTDDSCDPVTGACVNVNNAAACDDGDPCTTGDTCSAGVCVGGAPPNCDDSNVCTDDSCDPFTGACVNTNNSAACDDGSACTVGDTCSAGVCVGGAPPNCDDGNTCTDDSCDPASGCINANNAAACDDGNACTVGDACSGGACVAGTPLNCDDGNICTDDSCDPFGGCVNVNNAAPCDDGDACTTGDACSGGACTGGTAVNCDDGLACNGVETCDTIAGCQSGSPVNCDDGVACTIDACNEPSGACTNTPSDAACDDGVFCNGVETCDAFLGCLAGTAVNCDDLVGCTDDACNEATNSCDNTPNNANCDDGLFCNGVETCDAVFDCQAGTPVNCDDGVACTDDVCNNATGSCDNTANDLNCPDDGLFCNGVESCDPVADCVSSGDPCAASETCNEATGTCDPALIGEGFILSRFADFSSDDRTFFRTDTIYMLVWTDQVDFNDIRKIKWELKDPNGQKIKKNLTNNFDTTYTASFNLAGLPSNSTAWTWKGTVQDNAGAQFKPTTTITVLDAPQCTIDADCDDGVFCNGAETCDAFNTCQPGTDPCPGQGCDEATATCADCFTDADCDDGVFCNGAETCDTLGGVCQAGVPVNCDDGVACTDDACNEGAGTCDNVANDANCDNGVFCDGAETCDPVLGCLAGTALTCDDGVFCTDDSCDEATASCINLANNAFCPDDGVFCNGMEFCDIIADCTSTGSPCAVGESCNELNMTCDPGGFVGEGYILSRNPDFSTDDRTFSRTDVIYMLVWTDQVDFNDIRKIQWELKDPNKKKVKQNLTNNFDITYTASFDLTGLPSASTTWTWKSTVEDNAGNKFKPSDVITVLP